MISIVNVEYRTGNSECRSIILTKGL